MKQILVKGCVDKSKKTTAAQMEEKLRTPYPNR